MRFTIFFILFLPLTTNAQIERLTAIPFVGEGAGIGELVFGLYLVAITVAAVFAVVKLAIAGIKYATSDVASSKEAAKSDIKGAVLGLLILLGVVILVDTINENIADTDISLPADLLPPLPDPPPCDDTDPECDDFPPDGTVIVACTGQGTPTSGPCDEEMEACESGRTLSEGEIGQAVMQGTDVYCMPTGETDLEAYEEWCEEGGGRFVIIGDEPSCPGFGDEDQRDFLEEQLAFLDDEDREEIIESLLSTVGSENIVYDTGVLDEIADDVDAGLTVLAIEPPTGIAEREEVINQFEAICSRIATARGSDTMGMVESGPYYGCVDV